MTQVTRHYLVGGNHLQLPRDRIAAKASRLLYEQLAFDKLDPVK
jgi:hypothetical protein